MTQVVGPNDREMLQSSALYADNENKRSQSAAGNENDNQRMVDYDEISEQNNFADHDPNLDEPEGMTDAEKSKKESELLFWVQGVGSEKQVGGVDVYVKHDHCEESLKELFKYLKFDSSREPFVRHTLGRWGFLNKNLLPLLIFHHQDKKLSFLCLMLFVQLTELPNKNCESRMKIDLFRQLHSNKKHFLAPKVIETLIMHMNEILQKEERSQKHEQMIELVIVLFKQLLQIPEGEEGVTLTGFKQNVQKTLLLAYKEHNVLDLLVYLSNDFDNPLNKKLAIHLLEIQYNILKNFTPAQIVNPKAIQSAAYNKAKEQEDARQRKSNFVRSMRHGKFGFQSQIKREDGTTMSINNIYQKQIDTNLNPKYQRRKPGRNGPKALKDVKKVIEAPEPIIDDGAVDESDEKLLQVIKDYLFDMLEHSYNPLFEQLFDDIGKNRVAVEENDSFHMFKVQNFVLEAVRIRAKAEHQRAQQESNEAAKKQHQMNGKTNSKPKLPAVPFKMDVLHIGVSLQFQSFDFLYSTLYRRSIQKSNVKGENEKVSDKEFNAAIQLFYQILHIVQLMASCSESDEVSEKNRKNANILRSFIFRNDVVRICLFAFQMYQPSKHSQQFLEDIIGFTHTFLEHLEEFSKGRMLMIKTGRRRKVRKQKKARATQNAVDSDIDQESNKEENEDAFDPDKPDQMSDDDANGQIEDTFHDVEMDEESDREENVERQLNFSAEISLLINYDVVSRYMSVVDLNCNLSKKADLVQMTASFFRRIVFQLKQTWIFYQMNYMNYFNNFLQQGVCNNSLMKGIMENMSGDSYGERKLRVSQDQLRQIVTIIVGKFVQLQIDNPMLAMEALFQFQSKEIKDQVLNNYSLGIARAGFIDKESDRDKDKLAQGAFDDNIIFGGDKPVFEVDDDDEDQQPQVQDKDQWTQKQDEILIENYQNFASLEKKSRFTFLAELVGGNKTYKDCYNRSKLLKLKKGSVEQAKEISSNLLSKQGSGAHESVKERLVRDALTQLVKHLAERNDNKVAYSNVKAMCNYLKQIQEDHKEHKKAEEDAILFGRSLEMADIRNSKDLAMRVIPVTQEEFKMLRTGPFVAFLAAFGIRKPSQSGKGYLQVQPSVTAENLERACEQIRDVWLPKFEVQVDADGNIEVEARN